MHPDLAAQAADLYRADTERAAREERAARRIQKEARQEKAWKEARAGAGKRVTEAERSGG
jgi:hypothetical protein